MAGSSLDCTRAKIASRLVYASKKKADIHVNTLKTCADEHGETSRADVTSGLCTIEGGTHSSRELKLVIRDAPIRVISPKIPTHANSNQTIPKKVLFPDISTKMTGKIRSRPIVATTMRYPAATVAVDENRTFPSTMLRFQTATLATIALEMTNTRKTK